MRTQAQPVRAGTAMGEMMLVLPLLMVILALLVYFGRGVVRVQHAQVMDRYEAWRQAAGAPGPGVQSASDNPQLNQLFFGANAAAIEHDGSGYFPNQATDQLIAAVAARNAPTEYQLPELVTAIISQNPRGRTDTFTTRHDTGVPLWQRFSRPTRHRHTRIGHDWAHVNGWAAPGSGPGSGPVTPGLDGLSGWHRTGPYGPNVLPPIRDVFFPSFDANLANVANPLAGAIRDLYLSRPGYGGPTVEP